MFPFISFGLGNEGYISSLKEQGSVIEEFSNNEKKENDIFTFDIEKDTTFPNLREEELDFELNKNYTLQKDAHTNASDFGSKNVVDMSQKLSENASTFKLMGNRAGGGTPLMMLNDLSDNLLKYVRKTLTNYIEILNEKKKSLIENVNKLGNPTKLFFKISSSASESCLDNYNQICSLYQKCFPFEEYIPLIYTWYNINTESFKWKRTSIKQNIKSLVSSDNGNDDWVKIYNYIMTEKYSEIESLHNSCEQLYDEVLVYEQKVFILKEKLITHLKNKIKGINYEHIIYFYGKFMELLVEVEEIYLDCKYISHNIIYNLHLLKRKKFNYEQNQENLNNIMRKSRTIESYSKLSTNGKEQDTPSNSTGPKVSIIMWILGSLLICWFVQV